MSTYTQQNKIPLVIIHTGYRDYLRVNLEISGKKNKIYLIGDESNKHLEKIHNVTFVDISQYRNLKLIQILKKFFTNFSSNNSLFEWVCFERVFILKFFMEQHSLEKVFHMDSDNILLTDINTYKFKKKIAYCLCKNYHDLRMSHSIHVGLLTIDFCDAFIQLYKDLYVNKSKFHLIEDKIKYHTGPSGTGFIKGGICDMTLYYLLVRENILEVQNLLEPNNDREIFINQFQSAEGSLDKNQYELIDNFVKINFLPDKLTVNDTILKQKFEILNIHFQGNSKRFLNDSFKNKLI